MINGSNNPRCQGRSLQEPTKKKKRNKHWKPFNWPSRMCLSNDYSFYTNFWICVKFYDINTNQYWACKCGHFSLLVLPLSQTKLCTDQDECACEVTFHSGLSGWNPMTQTLNFKITCIKSHLSPSSLIRTFCVPTSKPDNAFPTLWTQCQLIRTEYRREMLLQPKLTRKTGVILAN